MATRHEEKYILDYRQYAILRSRAMALLTPDSHGQAGSYVINSLYYDDPMDSALLEKLDGLPEHRKFRVRTYNYDCGLLRLERKDKHGILTEKSSAVLSLEQLPMLAVGSTDPGGLSESAGELAAQMRVGGLRPSVVVRYERDAFLYPGSDLRLTFDRNLEAIPPDPEALFDCRYHGVPVLNRGSVIMEIKYGVHLPHFARKFTELGGKQLSVSKYALCRGRI